MAIFRVDGREWHVTVDGPKIRQVRAELGGFDLGARDASQFGRLTDDPLFAAEVLWILCRKQAADGGVTQEQFDAMLGGDAGEAAAVALLDAVIDFFPSHQRQLLKKLLAQQTEIQQAATANAEARLLDPATMEAMKAAAIDNVDAAIDQAIANLTRRRSVTASPESAVSARTD